MKKLFTMLMSVALLATMVVGGTLASEILSFNENADTYRDNMIIQTIQTKNSTGTVEAVPNYEEQDNPVWDQKAMPAVYEGTVPEIVTDADGMQSKQIFYAGNVIDYAVSVTNNHNEPVYVRTVFAFENTNGLADRLFFYTVEIDTTSISAELQSYVGWHVVKETVGEGEDKEERDLIVNIDGIDYKLYTYLYSEPIAANATSSYSLKQFCFDNAIKNFDLDEYHILVKSQAIAKSKDVEAFDLNTAIGLYGPITKDYHPWKETVTNTNE